MFPENAHFSLIERRNAHAKNGKEWALFVQFDGGNRWNISTFTRKPSNEEYENCVDICLRSMEVFFRHIERPAWSLNHDRNEPMPLD